MNTELEIATEHLGVTVEDHLAMQLDALEASFAPAETRAAVAAELAAVSPTVSR